ncbi:MAG: vanadium-dependent haloperoxidase [Gammaproteobacteria bacterium]|nr:vanadium-dependent haloperoxidase [Gammaproteobacteria bacterium]
MLIKDKNCSAVLNGGLAALLLCALSLSVMSSKDVSAHGNDAKGSERAYNAYKLRSRAAWKNFLEPIPEQPDNGDEDRYLNRLNSYSKGLPHDENGLVDASAYELLLKAVDSGKSADFEVIPKGIDAGLGLRNPLAAFSYLMEGKDPHSFAMPAAPAFNSAWQAADAAEVMWQALTRDVPYSDYATSPLITAAVADMNSMSDYRGARTDNAVSSQSLFRGVGVGETTGPYISQFLLMQVPYGATKIEQKYNVPVAGNDHLTNYQEWLHIQKGGNPSGVTTVTYEDEPRYIYNGRSMAQYVLKDFVNQAYLNAAQIMRKFGSAAYDKNDPYKGSEQARSPLFGNNHAVDLLSRVSMSSQNVAWFQKWLVHRRARPEVFFGRVHNHLTKEAVSYPLHDDILSSASLQKVYAAYGTYLLPTATPKGSPLHPTYPAGHSVMAGAAVTMLKAFFNGDYVIPAPVMTSHDGKSLLPFVGAPLTIEGELNKLASNISLGRDIAGVHYRTDGDLGIALGEEFAISVLRELVRTYSEEFEGFSFNRFDGTAMVISK